MPTFPRALKCTTVTKTSSGCRFAPLTLTLIIERRHVTCPHFCAVVLKVTTFDALDELRLDVETKLRVWTALRDWSAITASWLSTPIQAIAAEDVERQVQQFMKIAIQVRCGL